MLDTLLMVAAFAPGLIIGTLLVGPSSADGAESQRHSAAGATIVALGGFGLLGLIFHQWWLVSTTGQSLGKRWLRIRIVTTDGDAPGFWRGVFLRSWVVAVLGAIPMLGSLLSLVNAPPGAPHAAEALRVDATPRYCRSGRGCWCSWARYMALR